MLKIRLQRVGRRNHAEFRVVVSEHTRSTTSARYVDHLGAYNPHTNTVTVDAQRAIDWIGKGAQPSDTVHNLFVTNGIIKGDKVLPKKSPAPTKEPAAK
ncbi:MAG: 30S ribosomal protein S16 [Candidatus Pacebacteria bacterium]|nr:30S ribosomal protein S16 [Candidatus Paceibacterota bacterium]